MSGAPEFEYLPAVSGLAPFGTGALVETLDGAGIPAPSDVYRTGDGDVRLVWMPTQLRLSSLDVSPDGTVSVVTTRIGDGPSDILNYRTVADAQNAAAEIRQAVTV